MHLIKYLDNLTCCYIDLLRLNSYNTGYYIVHLLEHFILLQIATMPTNMEIPEAAIRKTAYVNIYLLDDFEKEIKEDKDNLISIGINEKPGYLL